MNAPLETRAGGGPGALVESGRDGDSATGTATGALPNLIVIGAQKCGTSGLHSYLRSHPQVSMSTPKELNFFIEERNWRRGVDWYARHFDPSTPVRGESSPNYTAYPQHVGVPERMHAVVPDARLIYLVRDPLHRIAAHWVHNYAKRREKGDLAATLMHPNTSYLVRSQYFMQLQRFLPYYEMGSRIMVLEQNDLRYDRRETLRRVFEFAGVDPEFDHPEFERERHATSRKRRSTRVGNRLQRLSRTRWGGRLPKRFWDLLDVPQRMRREIEQPNVAAALPPDALEVLREDAERFRDLVGRPFEHWTIWSA